MNYRWWIATILVAGGCAFATTEGDTQQQPKPGGILPDVDCTVGSCGVNVKGDCCHTEVRDGYEYSVCEAFEGAGMNDGDGAQLMCQFISNVTCCDTNGQCWAPHSVVEKCPGVEDNTIDPVPNPLTPKPGCTYVYMCV